MADGDLHLPAGMTRDMHAWCSISLVEWSADRGPAEGKLLAEPREPEPSQRKTRATATLDGAGILCTPGVVWPIRLERHGPVLAAIATGAGRAASDAISPFSNSSVSCALLLLLLPPLCNDRR